MPTIILSETHSSPIVQRIPLVERRPHFEEALARINQYKKGETCANKEGVDDSPLDSFGVWFEWD